MSDSQNSLPDDQQEDIDDLGGEVERFDAVVTATDWTVATILQQLTRGNIDLNPDFQRRQAWKDDRKSQFIESLILNVPVPQIVLAERRDRRGSFIVIDGKQRLLALRQFVAAAKDDQFSSFRLQKLPIRDDLSGLLYADMCADIKYSVDLNVLENSTIRTAVIRNWPNEKFLYIVFLRLNTGSVPLSPQELRQALHPGTFMTFVDKYSIESDLLRGVLRLKAPDFRMRDAELVLRYYAFRNYLSVYKGNLKPLLDYTAEHLNNEMAEIPDRIYSQRDDLERSIRAAIDIFGMENAFRKWNGERFEYQINRAIFDIMTVNFHKSDVISKAIESKLAVNEAFKALCVQNSEFKDAIEGTTKSLDAIYTRFFVWANTLNDIGIPIDIPRRVNDRILIEN
jgi:hypothetical protein